MKPRSFLLQDLGEARPTLFPWADEWRDDAAIAEH